MREIKQPLSFVYSNAPLNKKLMDLRPASFRQIFGTIENICRQYGIKHKNIGNCIEFSAPKSRLQLFIEKLHFSRTFYRHKKF